MRIISNGFSNLIYVHPVRTAGTSIESFLDGSELNINKTKYTHCTLDQYSLSHPEDVNYRAISFIRDPFDWVKSIYLKIRITSQSDRLQKARYDIMGLSNFDSFLEYILALDFPPLQCLLYSKIISSGEIILSERISLFEYLDFVGFEMVLSKFLGQQVYMVNQISSLNSTSSKESLSIPQNLKERLEEKFKPDFLVYQFLKNNCLSLPPTLRLPGWIRLSEKQKKMVVKLSYRIDPWWWTRSSEMLPYLDCPRTNLLQPMLI